MIATARQIADPATRADAALAALKSTSAVPAKCSLLRVLGGIGNAKALAAVRAALTDRQSEVKDAAVRTLADWPNPAALDALLAIFRTTDSQTHRVLVLRGAVRLLDAGEQTVAERLRTHTELLRAAKRPDDKRLVLAGLANVADPAALAAIEPLLAAGDVRAEAELAYLKVARAIYGSAKTEAIAAAKKLAKEAKSDSVRRQAGELITSGIAPISKATTVSYSSIVKVTYGAKSKTVDVTAKVKKLTARSGKVTLSDHNALFGDPIQGTPKELVVTIIVDGKERTVKVLENTPLTLTRKKRK